jgi:P27 family predicted phage terminase small subunit
MTDSPCPHSDLQEPDWAEAGLTAAEAARASEYWATIVAELQAQQTLAEANRHAIKRLVQAYLNWESAQQQVNREGLFVDYPNGTKQQHPALSVANKQMAVIAKLEADLGIVVTKRAAAAKGKVVKAGSGAGKSAGAIEF